MPAKAEFSLLNLDPAIFKKFPGSEIQVPGLVPVSSRIEVVENDRVAAMQALAPQFCLAVEVVAQSGETATDADFTLSSSIKTITAPEGKLAIRVTNPENISTTPFYTALREAMRQIKTE